MWVARRGALWGWFKTDLELVLAGFSLGRRIEEIDGENL